jgi:hypothetical protein
MMAKTKPAINAFIKTLAIFSLLLLYRFVSSFGQDKKLNNNVTNLEDGWWKPVLQKHKIDLNKFNLSYRFYS